MSDTRALGIRLVAIGILGVIGSYLLATYISLTAAIVFNLGLIAIHVGISTWERRPCRCGDCEADRTLGTRLYVRVREMTKDEDA